MSKHPHKRGVYGSAVSYSRSCTGKRQYASRNAALPARSRIRKQDRAMGRHDSVDLYRCRVCGYIHIGHEKAN